MQKFLLVILAGGALGMGGWRGYQYYQKAHPTPPSPATVAAAQAKQSAEHAAAEAKQQAAAEAKQQAAVTAARADIEDQLKPLKVTSIMPGQPGIAIIDKKEYAEGDPLPLARGGKRLQVTKIDEDGVLLAYNGFTFRLNPPAAPDLDALRKK